MFDVIVLKRLSSGEAGFYGIVKAASVGLGIQATLKDLGVKLPLEVFTDASAAKGIASRKGLGKTRHADVHCLCVENCFDYILYMMVSYSFWNKQLNTEVLGIS